MHPHPVGLRPLILGLGCRRWVETALQRLVAYLLRQRPAKAKTPRSTNALTCRRRADPKARGYLAFGHAAGAEPKHVADLAHGQSRSRHPQLLSKGAEPMPIRRSPHGPHHPRPQLVAIDRNRWSRSIGTDGRDHPVRALPAESGDLVPGAPVAFHPFHAPFA